MKYTHIIHELKNRLKIKSRLTYRLIYCNEQFQGNLVCSFGQLSVALLK